ncbi:unnamed protein product [Brachionus calyciflorus]|uniref:Uncharacterized protein n=1 Tax=Brachionus calyciflorus TaxID=104777 RepID=A0A814HHV7_9BILA|nr:unnamed protein product [Brachionus calyciflorus]
MNKIIILLLYVFLKLFAAQRFLSGSSSKNITLWNNVQRLQESKENFDVYSIDYLNEIFVSATSDNTVKAWNISSFSVVFQTPATQSELKYVVILNQSTCLAGYSKKIYFWSFPNLKEKKPIDLATLNEIQIFKLLKEENLVLIGSLNGKFHVFSLLTENVLDSYNQAGYALDGLNRNVIVSNCKSGICSFYLNSNNQINVNKTVSYSNEVYVAKLINSSLALFGVNELKLIIWDLKSSQVNQIDSDNAKIRSIEILDNDTFLTGMESDKIIVWNLKSITIKHIITTTGIIYALKKIDFDWNFPNGNSVSSNFYISFRSLFNQLISLISSHFCQKR